MATERNQSGMIAGDEKEIYLPSLTRLLQAASTGCYRLPR
jgi:hypothetical protein